jgi:hypothetical protein
MHGQRIRARRRLEVDVDASIEVWRGGTVDPPSSRSDGFDAYLAPA